jgi:hypothetical protein
MMNTPENQENMETAGLGQCHACGAKQPGRDRFCRQCGASQELKITFLTGLTGAAELSARDTKPLPGIKHHDSLSGALVNLVAESVSTRASSLSPSPAVNRRAMRMAGALAVVPIWLMIVLLSPLDAYVAARAIARRV